jgi:hypothetical protein
MEHRELYVKFIAARNGAPPKLRKAFVFPLCKIKQHDVVSSRILAYELCDKGPQESTKYTLNTLRQATECYIVEIIADSSIWKTQLISCMCWTCLPLCRGKEIEYS